MVPIWLGNGPKMVPKWFPTGSKIAPWRPPGGLWRPWGALGVPRQIFDRFQTPLGSHFGSKITPKTHVDPYFVHSLMFRVFFARLGSFLGIPDANNSRFP